MTEDRRALIASLELEEKELVLPRFGPEDAWSLGRGLADTALREGLPVAIDIRRPGFVLFRAAFRGTGPDQEHWIRRKSALVLRMEASSLLVSERFAAAGAAPEAGWLDPDEYALAGGSVPVRVAGVGVVAAVTASGLSSEDDHRLVVGGLRALLTRQVAADG